MFEFETRVGGLAAKMRELPQEELFQTNLKEADGTEVLRVFTIPVDFPHTVAIGYATMQRVHGDEMAVNWLLEVALGTEGLVALTQADVPRDAFVQVLAVIVGRTRGLAMEVPSEAPKALRKPTKKKAGSTASK